MPVLIIHGEKAHSRYNSETAFDMITGETRTNGVNSRTDNLDKIPFDKIESFLKESLEV